MTETYYIDKAERGEPWTNKYGNQMQPWKMLLKNEKGTWEAEMNQRPETPPPSGNIRGTISAGQFGNKFTKEKQATSEFSSGKSPEQQKSIVRQHSQHMAIMWAAILDKHGQLPTEGESNHIQSTWLAKCIDYFQMDAENVND